MGSNARIDRSRFAEIAPDVVKGLQALGKGATAAGLEPELIELINLRASQINGCTFCVQYHLIEARRLGVSGQKLDLLVVWPETDVFTDRERAALAWTETLTELAGMGVSDDDYEEAREAFSEREIAYLTAAVGTINVWNRIAVAFRYDPPGPSVVKAVSARETGSGS
jgi:AhpD family alkylhydroperoxidase